MAETNFTEEDMAGVALQLLPPIIRESLLSNRDFEARFHLKTEARIAFSTPKVSFQRSTLFAAVRSLYAEPNSTHLVLSVEKAEWKLTIESRGDQSTVVLAHNADRIDLSDLWPLSPHAAERLRCLEGFAEACNLIGPQIVQWRETLSARPIADDEFDDLQAALKSTPQTVSVLISREILSGTSNVTTLVPESDVYYDHLIGDINDATDLAAYVETIAKPHIAQLINWRSMLGLQFALLMSAHGSIPAIIAPDSVPPDQLVQLLKWLEESGDIYSQLGAIEFGLSHLDRYPNIEPHIVSLIEQICGDDPADQNGRFHLISALTILADGELARRQTLRTRPPFWRRLASIAQASLIERQLRTIPLDVAQFADFAIRKGGHTFFLQTLVDLRKEPRWMPDFVDPTQLKAEFIGRIAAAAKLNEGEIKTVELQQLVLGAGPGGVKALLKFPYPFLPGPLEGAVDSVLEMPPDFKQGVEKDLAAEILMPNSFAGLVNSALLYRIGPDLVALTTQALQRVKYQLRQEGPQDQSFAFLSGLATVAGVTRSVGLADQIRILLRVLKARSGVTISARNAVRICMMAAASHRDLDSWCKFVGDWIVEISLGPLNRSEAEGLAFDIETLCKIAPRLWRSCAKAEAACKAFLDA
jgi:hypothetical protein